MSDSKDPHGDERIEELLGQLQGIFGRLSRSEEEESGQKLNLPSVEENLPAAAAPPSIEQIQQPAPSLHPDTKEPPSTEPPPIQTEPLSATLETPVPSPASTGQPKV